EDGIRDFHVTGVQTCALPISLMINLVANVQHLAKTVHVVTSTVIVRVVKVALLTVHVVTSMKIVHAANLIMTVHVVTSMAKTVQIGRASCREGGEISETARA